MQVSDLDGNIYKWKTSASLAMTNNSRPRSQLHLTARSLLKNCYPTVLLCEEVPVRLRQTKKVFVDFYINTIKTVIEVHGAQHYSFNSLYHTCAQDFISQKQRDRELEEWCVLNGLIYIELPFNENKDQWLMRIQQQND